MKNQGHSKQSPAADAGSEQDSKMPLVLPEGAFCASHVEEQGFYGSQTCLKSSVIPDVFADERSI